MSKAALGLGAVTLGLAAAVLGVVYVGVGLALRDKRWLRMGRQMAWSVLAAGAGAVAVMEWALLSHDFSLAYVAANGSRSTPLLYTAASLWAALEGSILLWALVLGIYLVAMVRRLRGAGVDPLAGWATLVGLVVAAFFFALMAGPANPFRPVDGPVPLDGPGPNPLLQNHPLMAFHPPILYLGYVGFTVPFAYAVAALVTGRVDEAWLASTRRTTLFAWGCLTTGIVLGGWWSYEVLGWGGYWAWDPVENASLLPWLTGTAFLHSVIVQQRRGMLRLWNLSLVTATFGLTILGTFLTRSGVVNSVHSFTQSPIGPWLLTFLGVVAVVSVGLIAWRAELLRAPGRIDSPLSRENAFLVNNLLFAAFALVVLLGTVFPLVAEAYDGRQLSVGEPYFDTMTRPIGFALLLLMAIGPALPWRAASAGVLHRRLAAPAWAAALVMLGAALVGLRGVAPVLALGLGVFALAVIARQYAAAVGAQRQIAARSRLRTLVAVTRSNPRFYGGLIVHIGVVVFALAFTMSSSFSTDREVILREGETASVASYQITYQGDRTARDGDKQVTSVDLAVEHRGRRLGVYAPALTRYPNATQLGGTPSVRTGLREDLYLTVIRSPDGDGGAAVIGVRVNPLVVWLWIGAGIMLAGTAVALLPARPIRRVPSVEPETSEAPREAVLVAKTSS